MSAERGLKVGGSMRAKAQSSNLRSSKVLWTQGRSASMSLIRKCRAVVLSLVRHLLIATSYSGLPIKRPDTD